MSQSLCKLGVVSKSCLPVAVVTTTWKLRTYCSHISMEAEGEQTDKKSDRKQVDEPVTEELFKPLYNNGRFDNPWERWKKPGFRDLFKWAVKEENKSGIPWGNEEELQKNLPVKNPDQSLLSSPPSSGVQVMWIGHASVLVQLDGITVLTDPVFSSRCSPVPIGGPKRYRPPPCKIEDLPNIDAVVISHNHYDHLDKESVDKLNKRYGDGLKWFVPRGLKEWFVAIGCNSANVEELSWWDERHLPVKDGRVTFASVPCQHWSRRTITDENKSLWCGWVIQGPNHKFFFAGDTGYHDKVFKQIGEKYGPFNLAAIPIGAYEPRDLLKYQHASPEDAVQIHIDLNSKHSIGIHWGTFKMMVSLEPYMEPKQKLAQEVEKRGLPRDSFVTLNHGEVTHIPAG